MCKKCVHPHYKNFYKFIAENNKILWLFGKYLDSARNENENEKKKKNENENDESAR